MLKKSDLTTTFKTIPDNGSPKLCPMLLQPIRNTSTKAQISGTTTGSECFPMEI